MHARHEGSPRRSPSPSSRRAPSRPAPPLLVQRHGGRGADEAEERDPRVEGARRDLVERALASSGAPLPAAVRADLQPHLDVDLGAVRLHLGGDAALASQALGADAFTSGSHIAAPAMPSREVLTHELAHVAAQARGTVPASDAGAGLRVSEPGDAGELAADRLVQRVLHGAATTDLRRDQATPAPAPGPERVVQCHHTGWMRTASERNWFAQWLRARNGGDPFGDAQARVYALIDDVEELFEAGSTGAPGQSALSAAEREYIRDRFRTALLDAGASRPTAEAARSLAILEARLRDIVAFGTGAAEHAKAEGLPTSRNVSTYEVVISYVDGKTGQQRQLPERALFVSGDYADNPADPQAQADIPFLVVEHSREHDSERKAFVDVLSTVRKLGAAGHDVTAVRMRLFSQLQMCPSCVAAMAAFEKEVAGSGWGAEIAVSVDVIASLDRRQN